MFFILSKKLVFVLEIFKFLYFCFPFFFLVCYYFRGWQKINLKVYDINCLNKNLTAKKIYETEIRSIDSVLNKEHFYEKIMCKNVPKASPRPLLNFGKNPKQPLHSRNYFKNKIFWKRIISNPVPFDGQDY